MKKDRPMIKINPVAKTLRKDGKFRKQVCRPRKGKGSYTRKDKRGTT